MSIFGIILLCLLIGGLVFCAGMLIVVNIEPDDDGVLGTLITLLISIAIFVGSIFIGIGLNTESERIYVKKYLAQKETIEASFEVELSGLERLEIVKQVTELNAEFTERKANFELWYFVVYDNTIYDGVELIKIK